MSEELQNNLAEKPLEKALPKDLHDSLRCGQLVEIGSPEDIKSGGRKTRETTQSTKNVYLANIQRLNSKQPIKYKKNGSADYDFLKNTDKILERIQKLKPNSQRTYLISIVTSLKGLKPYEPVYEFYYDKMMTLAEELKNNGKASETESNRCQSGTDRVNMDGLKAQINAIIDKFFDVRANV